MSYVLIFILNYYPYNIIYLFIHIINILLYIFIINKLTFKYHLYHHNICFLLNKLTYKYKHKYNKPYIIQ